MVVVALRSGDEEANELLRLEEEAEAEKDRLEADERRMLEEERKREETEEETALGNKTKKEPCAEEDGHEHKHEVVEKFS